MNNHQFGLFGYVPPKKKIPISAARIKELMEAMANKDGQKAVIAMRSLREGLENYERRLHNGRKDETTP